MSSPTTPIDNSTIKVYRITKEACQSMIDQNAQQWDAVCSCCGSRLTPIETVDNSDNPTYWAGCMPCERFDWGVPAFAHKIATELVLQHNYVHYSHLGSMHNKEGAELEYWKKSQISGAAGLVSQIIGLYKTIVKP